MKRATYSVARSAGIIATAAIALALAACGGGGSVGGSNGGGGIIPTTPPPSTTTPAPPTITGKVVQMTGSLSSQVWNMAAASGCPPPGNEQPCAVEPTPIPASLLPTVQSTPGVGIGMADATIYVTTQAGVATNGVPSNPIAVATTAPDGSFSIVVPAGTPANIGLVAVIGTTISTTTGTTNLGYTVAHADAIVGTPTNLFVDTLDGDEQYAIDVEEVALKNGGYQPVVVDTMAQAMARLVAATGTTSPNGTGLQSYFAGGLQLQTIFPSGGTEWTSNNFGFDPATGKPIPGFYNSGTVFSGAAQLYSPAYWAGTVQLAP